MYFALHCLDKPNAGELRRATREAHLAHLATVADRILVAGPLLDDAGVAIGSLLVVDFEDRAAAEAFARTDPYAAAGLFASVSITAWRKVFPQ